MSVEIELVGGPADGRRLVIDGDPMDPPPTTETLAQPAVNWHDVNGGVQLLLRKALYRREVNPGDDGPRWLYRYDRQASEGPVRPDEEPTP